MKKDPFTTSNGAKNALEEVGVSLSKSTVIHIADIFPEMCCLYSFLFLKRNEKNFDLPNIIITWTELHTYLTSCLSGLVLKSDIKSTTS